MNRILLGVIAAAAIAAGASVSAAAAPYVGGGQRGAAFTGSAVGAYIGLFRGNDQVADLNRLAAVQSHGRESGGVGGGVPGANFHHRQVACIRVGQRLQC